MGEIADFSETGLILGLEAFCGRVPIGINMMGFSLRALILGKVVAPNLERQGCFGVVWPFGLEDHRESLGCQWESMVPSIPGS